MRDFIVDVAVIIVAAIVGGFVLNALVNVLALFIDTGR